MHRLNWLASFPFEASESDLMWIPTLDFSPDGERLIFSGTIRAPGLFTVELAGGEALPVPLPDELAGKPLAQPSYSPDGERVAFAELTGTGISVSTIWSGPWTAAFSASAGSGAARCGHAIFPANRTCGPFDCAKVR